MVLVTMGGVPETFHGVSPAVDDDAVMFVYSGQDQNRQVNRYTLLLDRNGGLYHPDLVAAFLATLL